MYVRFNFALWFGALIFTTVVHAQPGSTMSGTIPNWEDGEARIVLLGPRQVPPPRVRPAGVQTIGTITADGSFTLDVPGSFTEEDFVPVAEFLDPGCSNIALEPPDAVYFPVIYGVYRDDGTLIGEIFRGSPGAEKGPIPGEFTSLPGYAEQSFTLTGSCPDERRFVVEDYDFSVEAGWHELIQSFTEHPDKAGWRSDLWRNQAVPDQATWILLRPPR